MKLTKQQRADLYNKFNGRCAYCGDELPQRWHADHIEPVVRNPKWVQDRYGRPDMEKPQNNNFDNMNPSCPSCNILKNSGSIEDFRRSISHFIVSLNRDSNQYKFAKRYGLISETDVKVKFWFELKEEK